MTTAKVGQAQNARSEEELRGLAADSSPEVRRQVAANRHAPPDAIAALGVDRDWRTRAAVAARPDVQEQVGVALAEDKVWQVRAAIAENRNSGPVVWRAIAAAKDTGIRMGLARNKWLPQDISELMSADPSKDVRSSLAAATPHRKVLVQLLGDAHQDVRASALDNDLITEADIVAASHDRHLVVRGAAAGSELLPDSDRDRLLTDRSSYVRDEADSARRPYRFNEGQLPSGDDEGPPDLTDPQVLASWPTTPSKPRTKWLKLFPHFRPSQDEIPDEVAWFWRYSERIDRDPAWRAWWADSPAKKLLIYIQAAPEQRYDAEFDNDKLTIIAGSSDFDIMIWELAKLGEAATKPTVEQMVDTLMPTLARALAEAGRALGLETPPPLPPKP